MAGSDNHDNRTKAAEKAPDISRSGYGENDSRIQGATSAEKDSVSGKRSFTGFPEIAAVQARELGHSGSTATTQPFTQSPDDRSFSGSAPASLASSQVFGQFSKRSSKEDLVALEQSQLASPPFAIPQDKSVVATFPLTSVSVLTFERKSSIDAGEAPAFKRIIEKRKSQGDEERKLSKDPNILSRSDSFTKQ